MDRVRLASVGIVALAGAMALSMTPALAAPASQDYVCSGGAVPSGSYRDLLVTGACFVPNGATITVSRDLRVSDGNMLDAQSDPSTITVGRDVLAGAGSFLGLGCQSPEDTGNSAHPCMNDETGRTSITVKRDVTANDAAVVLLNGINIGRDVNVLGGGSAVPWSIKNDTVGRNLTVSGQDTNWVGVMFNKVGRDATVTNIHLSDTDPGAPGVYIVRNTVKRDLSCENLTIGDPPVLGVSGGFMPGSVNVVGRHATGQCASLV